MGGKHRSAEETAMIAHGALREDKPIREIAREVSGASEADQHPEEAASTS